MTLTAYAAFHLGIAFACALVACVHFVAWRWVPPDRTQFWGVIAFAAFALLDAGIAGSYSAGALGDTRVWTVAAFLGGVTLWWATLGATWALLGIPVTARRRMALTVLAALGTARVLDVAAAAAMAPGAFTWEDAYVGGTTHLSAIAKLAALASTIAILIEGARAVRRRNPAGTITLLACAPSMLLIMREAALTTGLLTGATGVGFIGLPYILAFSVTAAARYVAAARRETEREQVGEYRVLRRLASGGMGELSLAVRVGPAGFERHVALKKIRAGRALDEEASAKLLAEARLSARLRHPNVVAVHDVGRLPSGEGWFIAMEYLGGVDLALLRDQARQRSLALPVPFVLEVIGAMADGLAHAHGAGVVHGDVSPQNVMVTFDGAVKVIDFGIARELGGEEERGRLAGKIPYLPPEVLADGGSGGPRGDVWAVGVLLYELIAGERPFRGASRDGVAESIRAGHVRLSRVRPDLPAGLDALVEGALCAAPEGRFADAVALAEALRGVRASLPRVDVGAFVRRFCAPEWTAERRLALIEGMDDGSRELSPLRPIAVERDADTIARR